MQAGKVLLSALAVISLVATAIADLSYLHAGNESWPPHARLHAVWAVLHVAATHVLALGLLWQRSNRAPMWGIRVASLILLAYAGSFFLGLALAPGFDAALAPDVPIAAQPPRPLGMDGNLLSFLVGTPLILLGWGLCERAAGR